MLQGFGRIFLYLDADLSRSTASKYAVRPLPTLCIMAPPALLSTGLAVASLAPFLLQIGAATLDTNLAFAVSTGCNTRGILSTSVDGGRHVHHHERSRTISCPAATPLPWLRPRRYQRALSRPWSTSDDAHCLSQLTMGGKAGRAGIAPASRGRRRWFSRLRAAATSASFAAASEGGRDGTERSPRRGGSVDVGSVVDRATPAGVPRALSIREQMILMLRPDIPRVRPENEIKFNQKSLNAERDEDSHDRYTAVVLGRAKHVPAYRHS